MYDGLEGSLLRIVPSEEAHPPNMLTTGHSSDPSRIFPAFANIAFVYRRHALLCRFCCRSQLSCALGLLFASLLTGNGIAGLQS
jgi:hypothetical protein